jgi:aminoglycoside phosphotransferase
MTDVQLNGSPSVENSQALLGDDLTVLIQHQNLPLKSIEPLARLDAPGHPSAAFCLTLTNGARIKARRTWNAARADRIHYFLELLGELGFPQSLAVHNSALLLDWVPGEVLTDAKNRDYVEAAARLLGTLHRTPVPPDCPYRCEIDITQLCERIDNSLDTLCDRGAVTREEAKSIRALAFTSQPQHADVGIIHTDVCPENLVVTPDGRLRPVDNESLQIGFFDLDLARSWHRWPLSGSEGVNFLAAYSQICASENFKRHFAFWFTYVLLDSTVYRLGAPSGAWRVPLTRLREFVQNPKQEMQDD